MTLADRLRAAAEQPVDLRRDKRIEWHATDGDRWWTCTRCPKAGTAPVDAEEHRRQACGLSVR